MSNGICFFLLQVSRCPLYYLGYANVSDTRIFFYTFINFIVYKVKKLEAKTRSLISQLIYF